MPAASRGAALVSASFQPVIDDLLARSDPRRLLGGERRRETEQPLLERGAMVEGQDIEGAVVPDVQVNSPRCSAPGLAGGVVFLDDRLMVLEGVHLGEIVVADDLGEAAMKASGS
jgi:hypothetical protein